MESRVFLVKVESAEVLRDRPFWSKDFCDRSVLVRVRNGSMAVEDVETGEHVLCISSLAFRLWARRRWRKMTMQVATVRATISAAPAEMPMIILVFKEEL